MKIRTPIARNTDPETSHLAAAYMNHTGKRDRQADKVLYVVKRYPNRTTQELAKLCNLGRDALSRRLPELATARKVIKGEARRCRVTERPAQPWLPTKRAFV